MCSSAGLIIASVFAIRDAKAAACCGTGYGIGQRLAKAERFAATATVRAYDLRGSWSSDSRFVGAPSGTYDRELRYELGAIGRVGSNLQLGALVPVIQTWRRAGDARSNGAGLGDVTLISRWDFVPVGGKGSLPGIAGTFTVTAPTGRPVGRSRDALGTDVTGLGVWEFRPGVVIEKAWWTGWFFVAGASLGLRTTYVRNDHVSSAGGARVAPSPRLTIIAAGGPTWSWGLGLAFGAIHEIEPGPTIDGVRAPSTTRRRTAALGVVSYDVAAQWSLIGTWQIDAPLGFLGQNENAGIAVALGVRWVRGLYD